MTAWGFRSVHVQEGWTRVKWGERVYLYLLCRALLLTEPCWFLPSSQRTGWTCMFTRKHMNCTFCIGSAERKTCMHFPLF